MHLIGICGSSGKIGRLLLEFIYNSADITLSLAIVAKKEGLEGKDASQLIGKGKMGVLFASEIDLKEKKSDVIIDFSHPIATQSCLVACKDANVPLVIGTTGHSTEQQQAIISTAQSIPILQAANMSLGVNLCLGLVKQAVAKLDESYDVEITEAHHRHKIDAPSGTALALAEVAAEARGKKLMDLAVYDRTDFRQSRQAGTIGFQVMRGGDIVGEHGFHLIGDGETIEIHHKARSRHIFVTGAIKAALWLAKQKKPGLYSMANVLNL